jgi:hypothetical protein
LFWLPVVPDHRLPKYNATHSLCHSFAHADEISTLSAVAPHHLQQRGVQVTGQAPAAADSLRTRPSHHQAPQLAVETRSSKDISWLTWTDVGVCAACVWLGTLAHDFLAGIVLTVVNVAIIVSVIKVFKARGSDSAKNSLSDI